MLKLEHHNGETQVFMVSISFLQLFKQYVCNNAVTWLFRKIGWHRNWDSEGCNEPFLLAFVLQDSSQSDSDSANEEVFEYFAEQVAVKSDEFVPI